jgi:hypothetical protein
MIASKKHTVNFRLLSIAWLAPYTMDIFATETAHEFSVVKRNSFSMKCDIGG